MRWLQPTMQGLLLGAALPPGWVTELPWMTEQHHLKSGDGSRPQHADPHWKVSRCGLCLQETCGSCSWVGSCTAVCRAKLNTQSLALRLKASHLRRDVMFAGEECGWNAGWGDITLRPATRSLAGYPSALTWQLDLSCNLQSAFSSLSVEAAAWAQSRCLHFYFLKQHTGPLHSV